MYSHPQQGNNTAEIQRLRQRAGRWLRILRENAGLSQRDLANALGIEYYTFISQIETGRGRIPPDRYIGYAQALNIDPQDFVRELMRYYDPVSFAILFGNRERPVVQKFHGTHGSGSRQSDDER